MSATHIPLPAIDNAIREVYSALRERGSQASSWATMSEDDLWRELVACILGSRVRFETAHAAIERMERENLFGALRRSERFGRYERDVRKALSGPEEFSERGRYPFPRMRANQIREAAERIYGDRKNIRTFLDDSGDVRDVRRRLASEVSGLGPKQASLFLRNVGYATHVAVLDIHVLTYMSWAGLTEAPMKSISTVRRYELLEDVFIEHAHSFGFTPDRFDLAVWVVVRVAKQELKTWA